MDESRNLWVAIGLAVLKRILDQFNFWERGTLGNIQKIRCDPVR